MDVKYKRAPRFWSERMIKALQAKQYYSDLFPVYDTVYYGALYAL
jgi:hypothetical protein